MAILRAHLYLPITDAQGNLLTDIDVRFYLPGTTTQITGPIFAFSSGSSELNPPVHYSNGIVDAYLANPQRVRLGITPTGQSEFFLEDVDFRHAGDNAVLVDQVLRLIGSVQPGKVVTGNTDGTASWKTAPGDPGAITAADVVNVPAGNVGSTDVQGALNELDAEKSPTGHAHAAQTATTTAFTPEGTVSATNVQAAIAELDSETQTSLAGKSPTAHTHSPIETVVVANSGSAYAFASLDPHLITHDANCDFTMPTAVAGASFTVVLIRSATAFTETWPASVKWPGDTAPTPSTGAGKEDVYTFGCFNGTNWRGFVAGQNF